VAPKQSRFAGSDRQVRGRVVEALRRTPSAGERGLARETGFAVSRVHLALEGLLRDGLIERRGRSYRLAE
jgi:DNA-binding IclR family transcriptional regulator